MSYFQDPLKQDLLLLDVLRNSLMLLFILSIYLSFSTCSMNPKKERSYHFSCGCLESPVVASVPQCYKFRSNRSSELIKFYSVFENKSNSLKGKSFSQCSYPRLKVGIIFFFQKVDDKR